MTDRELLATITELTTKQEQNSFRVGKFHRWLNTKQLATKLKITTEHSRDLFYKMYAVGKMDKKPHMNGRKVLFALKEYDGYTVDGDYFVKTKNDDTQN